MMVLVCSLLRCFLFFLSIPRPPRSTRTDTLFPYTTLFRSPFGLSWGVGPVLYLPTATEDTLGAEKWGAGPTAVALRQHGPWTYGILANRIDRKSTRLNSSH